MAVLRQFDRAHPRPDAPQILSVDLRTALTTRWKSEMLMPAYAPVGVRLSTASIGVLPIRMIWAIFDVDARDSDGAKMPASLQWREALLDRMRALRAATGLRAVLWFSPNGARVLYRCRPFEISTPEHAAEWRHRYAAWVDVLAGHGITADRLIDWQRISRLPFTPRVSEEMLSTCPRGAVLFGDLDEVGTWDPETPPFEPEVRKGRASAPSSPADGLRTPGSVVDIITRPTGPASVEVDLDPEQAGVFARLFSDRGWVRGVSSDGKKLHVICPWERAGEHEFTSSSATAIMLPSDPDALGVFSCLHASCASRSWQDVLNCFDDASKVRAGMMSRAERRARRGTGGAQD